MSVENEESIEKDLLQRLEEIKEESIENTTNFTTYENFELENEVKDPIGKPWERKPETERNPLSCPKCDKVYYFKGKLERHINRVHEKNKKRFKCPICYDRQHKHEMFYFSKELLDKHMINKHKKPRLFHCTVCPNSFFNPSVLESECVHSYRI